MRKLVFILIITALLASPLSAQDNYCAGRHDINRVAIVVDRSESFRGNLYLAGLKIKAYLTEMALGSQDQVYLIGMSAKPEIIGYYPGTFLTKHQQDVLKENLGNCTDEWGTDVIGAIELAIDVLHQLPEAGGKHLLVFSDCFVDDGKAEDGTAIHFKPLQEYDWTNLEGIHSELYFLGIDPYNVKGTMEKIPYIYESINQGDTILWNEVETKLPSCKPTPPLPPEVKSSISKSAGISDYLPWIGLAAAVFLLSKRSNQNQQLARRRRQAGGAR